MVRGDPQTEGTKGKNQGLFQAQTAEHLTDLTDQISTMYPGQKNYQRPPFSNRREGAKKKQQQEKNQ